MRGATLCLFLSGVMSGTAAASSSWSNLWSTPEQQAQHLLDSRQAAAAAPLFKDPRRRGFAQLRAGQYAQAAKSLAPLHDADSLYNRGNALAHTGQLRDALAAYDAALKQSPGNRDVVHNRDLVARALQKQQQQSPKSQQGSNGAGAGSSKGGRQDGAGGQQGHTGTQQAGGGDQPGRAGGQQAGTHGQQAAIGNLGQDQARQQAQSQADSHGQPGAQSGNSAQAGSAQQRDGTGQPPGSSAVADARVRSKSPARGAATGDERSNAAMQAERSKGATQPPPPPRSEQSLALDQWLRGIPDDSGELLRRKFMIEHMMKQQENAP